jgi:hypothetical protein
MNKFLLSLGLVSLLAGCGEPAKDKTTASSTPVEQTTTVEKTTTVEQTAPIKTDDKSVQTPANTETSVASEQKKIANDLVIDATSEQTMTASLDKMIEPLSDAEKEAFAEAFLVYAMSQVDMSVDEQTNQKNMLAALNGKSVKDILAGAEKIKADAEKTEQK